MEGGRVGIWAGAKPTYVVAQPDPDGSQPLQLSPSFLGDDLGDGLHLIHTLLLQLEPHGETQHGKLDISAEMCYRLNCLF